MTVDPQTFAALLRGINVGGRNRLPMPELRSLFESLGHDDVVTYIQSGNVVFRSAIADPGRTASAIERRIEETLGVSVTVLLRTAAELTAIEAANPFLDRESDRSKLHVVFLAREPAREDVAGLDPKRSPGDEFHVSGSELYLHLPTGSGRTKLTLDYFERVLRVEATARNWNTLQRLVALIAGPDAAAPP